jgi:transposase
MIKKDGRSIAHEVLETYRFATLKLKAAGVQVDVIAHSFNVTERAVYRWLRKAKIGGKNSLKSSKATGPASFLTEQQLSMLCRLLRKPATKLGYSTDLWSGPRVRHLIKHRFRIKYHQKHMPRLLKWLGLKLKFPERRALEQDSVEVKKWKRKDLPKILEYAKKKHALVFYADESLISLIPYVGKTWAFPNKKPIVRVSGKRGQHAGITAAVNRQGRMCFELTKEHERFTAKVFIRFIKKVHCEHPDRFVILIVDGAPIHKARIVKEFVEKNSFWLRLEILPAYSPELNPTEKSWRFLKTKKLNGSTVANKDELRKETRKMMWQIKKDEEKISSFFDDL